MNILILGNASDAHAAHLHKALTQAGATVDYWNTRLFPSKSSLFWRPDTLAGELILPSGHRLDFQSIKSVFWRTFSSVSVPALKDTHQQQVAFNDSMSALRSLLQACPARWINSWQAYQFHKEKPLQLSKVKQIGVAIPATAIGNNPERITEFAKSYERVIFKPVYGGAHTRFITEELLEPQRLSRVLTISPITIQEYIPGTNIRSYVIGGSVYSAEIRSSALDFREDLAAELLPVKLPPSVQQQCLAISKSLLLEWTAIDWRRKPTGEYIFLEANPSPMFIHFEHQTGFDLTQQLVALLIGKK